MRRDSPPSARAPRRHLARRRAPAAALAVTLPFVALLVASCASGSRNPTSRDPASISLVLGDGSTMEIRRGFDIRPDREVTVSAAQAWEVLPDVYADIGLEPDRVDPATREIGVSDHRFSRTVLERPASEFFDCGLDPGLNRPTADQVPINASIVTRVMSGEGGAQLRTVVEARARRTGGNAGTAACRSTGVFEELIGQRVDVLGVLNGRTP